MFEIRFKDIDPDTGDISQDMKICECDSEVKSTWIQEALEYHWFSEEGGQDPNREFYIKGNG